MCRRVNQREVFPVCTRRLGENATRTFLHSCAQRLGLQRLSSTIAMRVILSAMMVRRINTISTMNAFAFFSLGSSVGPGSYTWRLHQRLIPSIRFVVCVCHGQAITFLQLASRDTHSLRVTTTPINGKGRRLQRQKAC